MSAVDDIAAYLAHLKTGGNRIDQIIFDELPNGEEMTAMNELRRLLDERNMEYTVIPDDGYSREHIKIGSTEIWTNDRDEVAVYHLTPEQAVEATLESGTCENIGYYIDSTRFKCSAFGYNGWTRYAADGEDRVPNYCPNCGRKVVGA